MAAANSGMGNGNLEGRGNGAAGPFGIGNAPGVHQGEVAGNPQVLGPQNFQQWPGDRRY